MTDKTSLKGRTWSLPTLTRDPIYFDDDFRVYKEVGSSTLYAIPSQLVVTKSYRDRLAAVSLERSRGDHSIFIAAFSPVTTQLKELELKVGKPISGFYPIHRLDLRTITATQDPSVFQISATTSFVAQAPFSGLVIIQAFGSKNIQSFKAMLELPAGFVSELTFDVAFEGAQNAPVSISLIIRDAQVVEQTQ